MTEIRTDQAYVTQITFVEPDPGQMEEALKVMHARADFMAQQPGFISITLHRSMDGRRIVNYIQWRDRKSLEAAHKSPQFRAGWGHFGAVTDEIDPHLYAVEKALEADAAVQ